MSTSLTPFRLTTPWPTRDPFLFCVHHLDNFPAGTSELGPDPRLLDERPMGSDFSNRDGWNMYHGSVVPGFPQHPHRGFETVTYVLSGTLDHSDSLGATARLGAGDTQWLTAGAGIVHFEMMPFVNTDATNPTRLFQIWLNLAAEDKMADPHFSMTWAEQRARVEQRDDAGRLVTVDVVAGRYLDAHAPGTPPNSWAARQSSGVIIWHITLAPDAEWTLPHAEDGVLRSVYLAAGDGVSTGRGDIPVGHGVHLDEPEALTITAGPAGSELLVMGGRPIGEPVAQYGPFVMNTRSQLAQAFDDYNRTGFGGWPWPVDDPNHGPTQHRFAIHPDGRLDDPPA